VRPYILGVHHVAAKAVDLGAGPRQVIEDGQEGQPGLVLGQR
jgi:hypothetical protein